MFRSNVAVAAGGGILLAATLFAAPVTAARAQGADEPSVQGYACCNLRYQGDFISDGNWAELPLIPAGTPMRTLQYVFRRPQVWIDAGGKRYRLAHEYGGGEKIADYVRRTIVAEDPRPRIESWPQDVREAIRLGRVAVGMTKEQVLVSLGYPMKTENPSLDAPVWRYWVGSFDEYQVMWDAEGRVKEVAGMPTVLNRVVHGNPR